MLATQLFHWLGHGNLELRTEASGGAAHGEYLHYSFAWREKYGTRVRRRFPIDAFAAGFAAAATEIAFDLRAGSLDPAEEVCYACREPSCELKLAPGEIRLTAAKVERAGVLEHLAAPGAGRNEEAIAKIARGLKDYLREVEGDERGLVQGFGLYITRHLTSYYNGTAYDTIHHIEQSSPESTAVVEELFGESGHVCAFYTCGNILLSPEWEALVGPLKGEIEEVINGCVAVCRALGFGHWTVEELVPGKRLVMRATSNYEAPFYLKRYGKSSKPRCYFFANASRAIMQLAHRVDWKARPQLDDALYQNLFKEGLGWNVEQTLLPHLRRSLL